MGKSKISIKMLLVSEVFSKCRYSALFYSALFGIITCSILTFSSTALADMDAKYEPVEKHFSAATGNVCVCGCAYLENQKISVPRYFESGAASSCDSIEGQSCLAQHRGTLYRGITRSCEAGPRPADIDTVEGEILRVPIGSVS